MNFAPARRRPLLLLTALLVLLGSHFPRAQELPPIQVFSTDNYYAGTQNWMLGQDDRDFVYAANNEGLLEYDGQRWQLHPSPGGAIIRSVRAEGERVYTGSYMEFGFWERGPDGRLAYRSVSFPEAEMLLPDEQIWNILGYEELVIFQSLQQLHFYDPLTGSIRRLRPKMGVAKIFVIGAELYFSGREGGLFQLEGGNITTIVAAAPDIAYLWRRNGVLYAVTATKGIVRVVNGRLESPAGFDQLTGKQAYSATSLSDGGLAVGTISNGVLIFGANDTLRYQINQLRGLSNNTILSLYEDVGGNLWAGTDNGISCVNLPSPFRKYTDKSGELGTVHASARVGEWLYVGSNQGLFVRPFGSQGDFTLIPGTRGQVWALRVHEGTLFCGHDAGTFLVDGTRITKLYGDGTWTFEPVADHPELLLCGNYTGLGVLENNGGRWQYRNRVEGCDYSVRFLAIGEAGTGWFSHEYRGVFALRLDADYRRVEELRLLTTPAKWPHAGLASFQDSVYYLSGAGLFVLKEPGGLPERSGLLVDRGGPIGYTSGRMTSTGNRLWFFDRYGLHFLEPGAVSGELRQQTVPVGAELLNAKLGYENITPVANDIFLIGTADGYLLLDLAAIPTHHHELYLTAVTATGKRGVARSLPLGETTEVPYTTNQLRFDLAIPAYDKYFTPQYQYRLDGLSNEWSGWSTEATISYPGVPPGEYTLQVRSILGRKAGEDSIAYSFTVLRPWYLSWFALVFYACCATLLVSLFHRGYTRYYRRQREKIEENNARQLAAREREAELNLSRIRNEQLQHDIEVKNREMASNTMSLVKKNELLQRIKDALLQSAPATKNIKTVISIIDDNLNDAETWALFQDAFEQADRDFFRNVKAIHPELSPNDLRLCAYLRLNLSTKEIAPMLNISVRSVEVKRYRLRKKLALDREVNLTDYIMSL